MVAITIKNTKSVHQYNMLGNCLEKDRDEEQWRRENNGMSCNKSYRILFLSFSDMYLLRLRYVVSTTYRNNSSGIATLFLTTKQNVISLSTAYMVLCDLNVRFCGDLQQEKTIYIKKMQMVADTRDRFSFLVHNQLLTFCLQIRLTLLD